MRYHVEVADNEVTIDTYQDGRLLCSTGTVKVDVPTAEEKAAAIRYAIEHQRITI